MLKARTCATLLAAFSLTVGCRKSTPTISKSAPPAPAEMAPELAANRTVGMPQAFLWTRSESPVHWQHWEPALLDRALRARLPIFVFVGSPQYPGATEMLDLIDKDPAIVKKLNEDYVPVIVDSDTCRETGLMANLLTSETRQSVSFPFILFLSPEGSEVSWRPLSYSPGTEMRDIFLTSLELVSSTWKDSPDYFIRNSRVDHENRVRRLQFPDDNLADETSRKNYVRDATRQLVSLYDEDIGTLSGAGGLFPVGIMQCLAASSSNPDSSPEIAARCLKVVKSFSPILLRSAMVDPLDGGIYTARGGTWALPMSNRTSMTQARAARALVSLHAATGDDLSLQAALGAVKYAEQEFATPDGLFSYQRLPGTTPTELWLWTTEQLEQPLTPEEASLWKNVCGVLSLGNIPGEADPQRVFFRLNSLGMKMSPEAAAKKAGIDPSKAAALMESGRKKLIKARLDRNPSRGPDTTPSAGPSFRMVSAYAALYTATGDESWRTKAQQLAEKCRAAFTQGSLLIEQKSSPPEAACDARAFTYTLAIQACLDLAEVTLDDRWRIWAGDLSTTVGERFIDAQGHLLEAAPESTPAKLPIEDRVMIFDDSTAGVMRMNVARLKALGQDPPPALEPWLRTLPNYGTLPVVFTDSILAASFSLSRVIVDLPAGASEEWKKTASMLPLDRISRRIGTGSAAKLRFANGSSKEIATPDALKKVSSATAAGS
jgi:uncharacterized protein YyaL (SSP411 family)